MFIQLEVSGPTTVFSSGNVSELIHLHSDILHFAYLLTCIHDLLVIHPVGPSSMSNLQ